MGSLRIIRTRIGALCRNDSGVSAVEVGITMLPFLLVMFGTMEFGWYFLHTHTMNSAVSEGIRLGALGSVLDDGTGTGTHLSREDSIKKSIIDKAKDVMVIDPSDILIFPVAANWADPTDPAVMGTANAGGEGAFMRVRVTYNHEFFTDFIGGFFGGSSKQLTSESTYRNENFIL